MPPSAIHRRLLDANVEILQSEPSQPDFLHTVLAQCAMPRSKTDAESFERFNGNTSLAVRAGRLWDGKKWQPQPLPYGTRPRLALVHISSEAVRTQSRVVDVGDSTKQFLEKLGISTSGHEYRRFKQQMKALAAAQMQLGIENETHDLKPIRRFSAWLHPDDNQRVIWPGELELTSDFFDTLMEHAVPLDHRALGAISNNAMALDVYTWLAHRLHRVPGGEGVKLPWQALRYQFGQEYRNTRDFKRAFTGAMRTALTVYPDAKVDEEYGGVRLRNSPPPIPKRTLPVNKPGGGA